MDDVGQNKKNVITKVFSKLMLIRKKHEKDSVTEEEILRMVDAVNETGGIEESQAEMISNIFEFDDLEISDLMTHRTEVFAIEINTPIQQAVESIIREGFSRIPVYEDNIDNICGVVFAKDLLKLIYSDNRNSAMIKDFVREIKYVPESNSCRELLEYFSSQKNHIAVVVDEYGGTAGIVTLEDLLESIVGNIQDEYDNEVEEIQEITPNTFDILGNADTTEVMNTLGKKLDDEKDYDTIAGFVTDLLGYIPKENQNPSVSWENIEFRIIKCKDNRIEKLRAVIKNDKTLKERS